MSITEKLMIVTKNLEATIQFLVHSKACNLPF